MKSSMAVTIKDIADIVGVSRGTVDRALHDRGRVNPEVARAIKKTARELGFEPSRAGRALALAKNPVKLGVIIHLTKTVFMQQVLEGIHAAKAEVEALGAEVMVRQAEPFDAEMQIQAINEMLAWGAQGIALMPTDAPEVRAKIDEVVQQRDIPIVTYNTDVPGSARSCFVGQDAQRSGETAAHLMKLLCGGAGKVAVITGYLTSYSHCQRVDGFIRGLQQEAPDMMVAGMQLCYDEEALAKQVTLQSLEAYPDLAGIFAGAGGQEGVCAALRESGMAQKVKLVVFDLLPATIAGLEDGTIDFVIDQNAAEQGRKPLLLLFDHLFTKAPIQEEVHHTGIVIKCRQNM